MKTSPKHPVSLLALNKPKASTLIIKVVAILLWTFTFYNAQAQLKGNYTIDPSKSASASNYKDFHSAVTDLDSGKRYDGGAANGRGVSGAVVFKVADGTYHENVHIFTIPGTSLKNNVLFESASEDSSKVIITFPEVDSSNLNGLFIDFSLFFEDVSYVSFKGMTLSRPGTNNNPQAYSDGILIKSSDSITITNCQITGNLISSNQFTSAIKIIPDPKRNAPSKVFILSNLILHCIAPITIQDGSDTIMIDGNIIDSCGTVGPWGINIWLINKLIFTRNYIAPGMGGISTQEVRDLEISRNIIYGEIQSDGDGSTKLPVLIANNEIWGWSSYVGAISDSSVNFYYNTFYYSEEIELSDMISVNFANNIVYDTVSSPIYANKTTVSDYNNYILNPNKYFCTYNPTYYYQSLQDWQSGTGNDLHSKEINPGFLSPSYPAPTNAAMNFGTPISGITTDINGNPRDPNHPTVGAFNLASALTDTTLCKNSCAIFTTPMPGISYHWSTGQTTKSVKYCPTTSGPVWLSVKYGSKISDTVHFQFYVTVTNTTCVWPGDANDDGQVDMNDLLNVGVAYSDTGSKRPNASYGWFAQSCYDWSKSFADSVNHKFADCDGNGIVDSSDLSAIEINYSKTHLKTNAIATGNPSNPPLSISFSEDSAMAGDTVQAVLSLGSKAIPASNVYGVALSISYGAASAATYSSVDFSNSWLGTYHKNMVALVVNNASNQSVDVGITRTDHSNASGYGEIGRVDIVMPDNLAGKRYVRQLVHFNIASYKAISANEDTVPLYPTGDSILLYEYKTSGIALNILSPSDIQVYPNPANDILHIKTANDLIKGVSVSDLLGRPVYSILNQTSAEVNLPLNGLSKGIYILNITTSKGISRTRFVKE